MPEKRKYTFRKNEAMPYRSGSVEHEGRKTHRHLVRNVDSAFDVPKSKRRKQSLF